MGADDRNIEILSKTNMIGLRLASVVAPRRR